MEKKYYFPELDIRDKTADELYIQVRNGYITNLDALHQIYQILKDEGKDEKSQRCLYIYGREYLDQKDNPPQINVCRLKIDFMDGRYRGVDDEDWGDYKLSVLYEQRSDMVFVHVAKTDEEGQIWENGTVTPLREFLGWSQDEFEKFVNAACFYAQPAN